MRTPLLALPLLLLVGCLHARPKGPLPIPTQPLPPEALALARPGDTDYAARVRLELTRKQDALRECLQQAPDLDSGHAQSEALYVSPDVAYFPRHSDAAPLRAFEQCVRIQTQGWELPPPVSTYSGVWVRFHFERGDTAATASRSPLFEHDGVHADLEVSGVSPFPKDAEPQGPVQSFEVGPYRMTRPVLVSGPIVQYTRRAREHGVEGTMKVKCVITTEGLLETCRILQPLPFMERAVLDAFAQNRYLPVTFKGQPMSLDYTFILQFGLPKR